MSTVWNTFAFIGAVTILALVSMLFGRIHKKFSNMQHEKWRKTTQAILTAENQSLEEAIKTLTGVGIRLGAGTFCNEDCYFNLPKLFWDKRDVEAKARALVTMVTYTNKHANTTRSTCCTALLNLFARQSKKNLGMVLCIVCELKKIAGDSCLFESFFSRLAYAEKYIK